MDENLAKIRHERSKKDFPGLSLEEDEYVEFAFKRARICMLMIISCVAICVIIILLGTLLTLMSQSMLDEMGKNFLFIILFTLLVASILIGLVALRIYGGNRLYVTNRRVIQMMMESLVSSSTNTIDLASVEDVSFHQKGIMQQVFHYGTLRLATVGDETTYTFKYSDISSKDLEAVSKLVTRAKKHNKKQQDKEED